MALKTKNRVRNLAISLAYTEEEVEAAFIHADRKSRKSHPPGEWDQAGRFYAHERSVAVMCCRTPSRKFPLSDNRAARTAAHCAEISEVASVTHVRRIATALDRCIKGASDEALRKLLTPGVKRRRSDAFGGQNAH